MYEYVQGKESVDYQPGNNQKTIYTNANDKDKEPDWTKIKTVAIKVKAGEGFYKAIREAGWPSGGKGDPTIVRKMRDQYGSAWKDDQWKEDRTIQVPSYQSYANYISGKTEKKETETIKNTENTSKTADSKKEGERLSDHYYSNNNGASILEIRNSNAILRNKNGEKLVNDDATTKTIPNGTLINIIQFGYYNDNEEMIAEVQNSKTGEVLGWTSISNLESRSFMQPADFRSQIGGKQPARITGKAGCRQGASDMLVNYLGDQDQCWLDHTGLHDTKHGVEYDLKVGIGVYAENGNYFRLLEENKDFRKDTKDEKKYKRDEWLKDHRQASEATPYINKYLDQGVPVEAGVDHTYNTDSSPKSSRHSLEKGMGYNDGTTDHYIVLTGRGITTDGKVWYTFFDPRTQHVAGGTALKNILYETKYSRFECRNGGGGKNWYHLSLVIIFPNDKKEYQHVITENQKLFKNGVLIDPNKK